MSSAASAMAQKKSEKGRQEFLQIVLAEILREEDNKYCADCEAKGPRWAAWNIGVFLCIRCAGCHRNLGVHISRVKSVNLDQWTDDQVSIMQQMGNRKAKVIFECLLPENFRRPQTDYALEQFIRQKYEQKRYVDRSITFEMPIPKPLVEPGAPAEPVRSPRSRAGGPGAFNFLPPVPSPQAGSAVGAPPAGHHRRTPSSSSMSPPLAAKTPASSAHGTRPSVGAPIIDLFDEGPPPPPQPSSTSQNTNNNNQNELVQGIGSINLVAEKPPIPQVSQVQTQVSSTFDELSFLAPPQQQKQDNFNAHPQQHHQRSVSNYDLMAMLETSKQQSTGSGQLNPAPISTAGAHDDILSLYKQQPTQSFGVNPYPMAGSAGMYPAMQNNAAGFSGFGGGFGLPPQQAQLMQQPMLGGGFPMMIGAGGNSSSSNFNSLQGGFQQPSSLVVGKPASANASPAAPAATTNSTSRHDASFDSLWQ